MVDLLVVSIYRCAKRLAMLEDKLEDLFLDVVLFGKTVSVADSKFGRVVEGSPVCRSVSSLVERQASTHPRSTDHMHCFHPQTHPKETLKETP